MITISQELLLGWVNGLLLPLTRILGLIAIAPIFGHRSVPRRVKLGLALALTLIVAPTLPSQATFDPLTLPGALILAQQLLIGVAMGFSMRIVFAGVEMAGQVIGMTMGLGFAIFFNPMTQGQSSPIGQFYMVIAMLLFLSMNGHLQLLATLIQSFDSLPISLAGSNKLDFFAIARWGEIIFRAALQISLPVVAALLVTNIALGILTRTAPQLNLFGIGFPITIFVGLLMVALAFASMEAPLSHYIETGLGQSQRIANPG
ncbi:flagellar biosynthetic protein FliR [Pseudomethylobacillus aquaticus]|uniref:Flagellar biosynthetic protein FliR n=1 Tax=Pseudomethylobacillus aquaticus TaxID=2676064 RepID=A0A3N0UZY9_9PROT|nr:flagellar biosynthetic protein FliR [Pseudomethylobacillus aquaticus]ROH86126.1 flagellar biosynthetic protein FliR [Pseudomethylobacillus aquaticus]